jgi:hypothetical protein
MTQQQGDMVEDKSEKRPELSHLYALQGMALEPVFPGDGGSLRA